MSVMRPMLAAFIALSIALVPAAGRNMVPVKPVEAAMHVDGDMPCCPCCPRDQDNSKTSVPCAIKCLNSFAAVLPSAAPLSPGLSTVQFSVAEVSLRPHVSSPPTHPPPA